MGVILMRKMPVKPEFDGLSVSTTAVHVALHPDWMPPAALPLPPATSVSTHALYSPGITPVAATAVSAVAGTTTTIFDPQAISASTAPLPNPSSSTPSVNHSNHVYKEDTFSDWYFHRPHGRLWDLVETIGRFRREGKNRRDNATVAIRVLRLARMVTRWKGGEVKVKGIKDTDIINNSNHSHTSVLTPLKAKI